MAGAGDPIDTKQLKALRRQIRQAGPNGGEFKKRLTTANKKGAEVITERAQAKLRAGTPGQARAARAIKPRSAQSGIGFRIANSGQVPDALARIWGAKRRAGWYGARRYRSSSGRQFPQWVGNGWEVGGQGGPYGLNPAIRESLDEVLDIWGEEVGEIIEDIGT